MEYKTRLQKDNWSLDLSKEELLVVPDQALSLQEILERFTRGEELDIGQKTFYPDEDETEDLEKLRTVDLVDKFSYIDQMVSLQKRYEDEEKGRQEALKKAAWEEALKEQRAALAAKKGADSPPAE